jgi:hypothetical protein
MLSTATNSLSDELRVFYFCLVELLMGKPLPIVNTPPVWLRILGCTANEASTYHINTPLPSALKIKGRSLSTLRYSIRWLNFLQSSTSGALTLIVRNAIPATAMSSQKAPRELPELPSMTMTTISGALIIQ